MTESQSWRRGFAAGFAALVLSVGGHLATSGGAPAESACSLSRTRLADRLAERFTPQVEVRGLAQRVARAVIGAMLGTCS